MFFRKENKKKYGYVLSLPPPKIEVDQTNQDNQCYNLAYWYI